MPYVGNEPTSNFASVTKDTFSGNGSTTAFTLSKAATTNGVAVFVENVRQEPTTAYAVSGTTLTFTAAPVSASGNNIYVLHHNSPASTATHPSAQNLLAVDGTFSGDVSVGDDILLSSDSSAIKFGADGEITLTHSADDGLILKHVGTGDGKEPRLTFQAGDTDIAVDDLLGSIEFQAPDEGTGTDSQLVAAAISAVSEGDFSASSNATGLRFQTGASETATTKMTLTSEGLLGLGTSSPGSYNSYGDGLVIAKSSQSGSAGMSLISATDGYGSIYFNDGTGQNTHGAIDYTHSTDAMRLRVAGNTALTLDQSGKQANFGITGERAIINRAALTGISLADDASTSVAGFSGSSSALILVYDPGGGGAVFFATYQNAVAKLAGSSDYSTSDSDGNTCVFKSGNSHSVTLKNREGSGTSYYVLILQAYD